MHVYYYIHICIHMIYIHVICIHIISIHTLIYIYTHAYTRAESRGLDLVQRQVDELLPLKNKIDDLRQRAKEIKRAILDILNNDEDMSMMFLQSPSSFSSSSGHNSDDYDDMYGETGTGSDNWYADRRNRESSFTSDDDSRNNDTDSENDDDSNNTHKIYTLPYNKKNIKYGINTRKINRFRPQPPPIPTPPSSSYPTTSSSSYTRLPPVTSTPNPTTTTSQSSSRTPTTPPTTSLPPPNPPPVPTAPTAPRIITHDDIIIIETLFETYLNEIEWISSSIEEYLNEIINTEENVVLQLDILRNRILRFELNLSMLSFVATVGSCIAGIYVIIYNIYNVYNTYVYTYIYTYILLYHKIYIMYMHIASMYITSFIYLLLSLPYLFSSLLYIYT